jgi:hypothetical protein
MTKPICPACWGYIPNNETPGAYMGALSRRDNKTEICSPCGNREAMEDYAASMHAPGYGD